MKTTRDWLAEAAGSDDAASCLRAAEGAADRADDWLEIAAAWQARDRRDDARRCAEVAAVRGRAEIWATRHAAARFVALDDRARAAEVLAAFEQELVPRRARAYEAVLLARAYREVLADEDAVRRCIADAAARAVEPSDLADAAAGHAEYLGDLDGARALLERADAAARATGDQRARWGIANRWKEALRDPARARAVLASATDEATTVMDLTSFAIAWRSLFGDEAELRRALARGERLASTCKDWLRLAEGYRDGGHMERLETWDPDGVRRCLERARAASPTQDEHNELAAGLRRWLGDDSLATPLTPPQPLLEALRARVTPRQLDAIARADYGMDFGKHQAALVEIHASGRFATPLSWYPREVCELCRWDEGAKVDHVARAFACAILAIDAVMPDTRQIGDLGDVLAPLAESAWALGLDAELEALCAWAADAGEPEGTASWARAALALAIARRAPADPRITAIADALPEPSQPGLRAATWRALLAESPAAPARLAAFLCGDERR